MRVSALLLSILIPLVAQAPSKKPLVLSLACAAADCPLLTGAPQTAGMVGGFVRLKPNQSVGWHSTGQNEESLVVLRGSGDALIEGQPNRGFTARQLVYIPPGTRHNVSNTGQDLLEYVYLVAPAGNPKAPAKP